MTAEATTRPDRTLGTAFKARHGVPLWEAIKAHWFGVKETHKITIHGDGTASVHPDGPLTTEEVAKRIRHGI